MASADVRYDLGECYPRPRRLLLAPARAVRADLAFARPVTLLVSDHNPGAAELAAELRAALLQATPPRARSSRSLAELRFSVAAVSEAERETIGMAAVLSRANPAVPEAAQQPGALFFLLYLRDDTFAGEAGERLAEQLRLLRTLATPLVPQSWLARHPRVLLVHERDRARGGCAEFGRFFETTPEDLVEGGLYADIAVAFHEEPFRQVSLALAARKLGACANI
eukprot:CAMPEP_0119403930 /NCGR_PEP_ID=MMETSP1334-20130426/143636_1 /TAXON_ID=127549 /ORGANISM="Calcidiscus leptoporus, Strain RCC1130" /LENGTH=223 /DNA_ID=CAMNT_0007427881 /DNA_START=509 /DNA_END=1177 /DNA_ORIENTATION=-